MNAYQELLKRLKTISDISRATGVLHWDTEVNMPEQGAAVRAQQISTLAGIAHDMFVDDETLSLLDRTGGNGELSEVETRNIYLARRDYNEDVKLPTEFVREVSQAQSIAYVQWVKARRAKDFHEFAPALTKLVDLKRRETDLRGYKTEPYDSLLDVYEHGLRASWLEGIFEEAKAAVIPLTAAIAKRPAPDTGFLTKFYGKDSQWQFGLDVMGKIGYDFQRGRQDISPHPFTISFHPDDVRVTTHVNEHDFRSMTWSCLHELGHALYEQGLKTEYYGQPIGHAASLSIHESQSRLWENHVGRSRPFWEYWYPVLQERFPENLQSVDLETFYKAVNAIEPNLIRIEADELHYHLHIIIRFEIERALINGDIEVADLPSEWNKRYKAYLRLDVPDDSAGLMQDVHWSHGSFGYFPTYSLGSFYAAQFYRAAESALEGLDDDFRRGDCSRLLNWLREHIHVAGRLYEPADLCRQITGEELQVRYFVDYAQQKFGAIYEL